MEQNDQTAFSVLTRTPTIMLPVHHTSRHSSNDPRHIIKLAVGIGMGCWLRLVACTKAIPRMELDRGWVAKELAVGELANESVEKDVL